MTNEKMNAALSSIANHLFVQTVQRVIDENESFALISAAEMHFPERRAEMHTPSGHTP